jgi:hypothetical protein
MPLTPYLKDAAFDPAGIEVLNKAFTAVCDQLQLAKRDDPFTAIVARMVIDAGRLAPHDADRIRQLVMLALKDQIQRCPE